jgi:hypothetical protein
VSQESLNKTSGVSKVIAEVWWQNFQAHNPSYMGASSFFCSEGSVSCQPAMLVFDQRHKLRGETLHTRAFNATKQLDFTFGLPSPIARLDAQDHALDKTHSKAPAQPSSDVALQDDDLRLHELQAQGLLELHDLKNHLASVLIAFAGTPPITNFVGTDPHDMQVGSDAVPTPHSSNPCSVPHLGLPQVHVPPHQSTTDKIRASAADSLVTATKAVSLPCHCNAGCG